MPKYYLLDENKNLVEGFDKEGFLALLQQAIDNGDLEHIDPESAVASKIRSILNGTTHNIEFVTQAQYNQLEAQGELVENTYYFITDDTTAEDIEEHIDQNDTRVEDLENKVNEGVVNSANILTGLKNNNPFIEVAFDDNGFDLSEHPLEYGNVYEMFYRDTLPTTTRHFGIFTFIFQGRSSFTCGGDYFVMIDIPQRGEAKGTSARVFNNNGNSVSSGTLYYRKVQ